MLSQNDPQSQKISGDILIIDDTPATLRFLADLLNKAGYVVRKVTSGEQGLETARLEPPDLILLDVKMPGLDGYKVCDRLKSIDRTRDIPIIFLSAMHEELDKVLAFEAGGVDYITKPFQIVEVLARIETHLQVSRLQQKLQQQNAQLQQEIEQRISAEMALGNLSRGLDTRTCDQTTEAQAQEQQVLSLQTELQQALAQEKHLNKVKSKALTTIAQKLAAAVVGITASVESLRGSDQERSNQQNQQLQTIEDSTHLIQQALQEALALIEPVSQPLSYAPQRCDLTQFCQSFVNQWQLPNRSFHQLAFVSWGKSPGLVLVDEVLLQQVFSQLLSNAICYSPLGGTILIQLVYESTQILIHFRDEGMGIPKNEIDRILAQSDQGSNANQVAGADLGLAIAKQAIELHGGSIAITSEVGKGTIVTLTLPIVMQT